MTLKYAYIRYNIMLFTIKLTKIWRESSYAMNHIELFVVESVNPSIHTYEQMNFTDNFQSLKIFHEVSLYYTFIFSLRHNCNIEKSHIHVVPPSYIYIFFFISKTKFEKCICHWKRPYIWNIEFKYNLFVFFLHSVCLFKRFQY